MDKLVVAIVGFLAIMLGMATFGLYTVLESKNLIQTAQATGCPVETITPFIDDAIKSIEAGDTQTALSQLNDAKNELSDSYEVDEK